MDIIIVNTSAEPLYAQIVRQIKRAVLTGEIKQGEAMPSIRHLSKELRVSIITTKRAYEDLEAEGFLQTTPGKGTFVSAASTERLREVALSQIEEKLATAIDAAKAIGLTYEELQEITAAIYSGGEGNI